MVLMMAMMVMVVVIVMILAMVMMMTMMVMITHSIYRNNKLPIISAESALRLDTPVTKPWK